MKPHEFRGEQDLRWSEIDCMDTLPQIHDVTAVRVMGGRVIRDRSQNLLSTHRAFVLDFEGARTISISFADEIFGHMFAEIEPRAFLMRIEMHSVDQTFEGLIEQTIVQQIKRANGGT